MQITRIVFLTLHFSTWQKFSLIIVVKRKLTHFRIVKCVLSQSQMLYVLTVQ